MTFSYFLQFLDKSSLNYAAIMGIRADTVSKNKLSSGRIISNHHKASCWAAILVARERVLLWVPHCKLPRILRIRQISTRKVLVSIHVSP
jgi:hypothetical protein